MKILQQQNISIENIIVLLLEIKRNIMKPFLFVTATFLFICLSLQTFAQEKIKSKSNEAKVKIKATNSTDKNSVSIQNNSLLSDSTEGLELIRLSKLWTDAAIRHDSVLLLQLMAPEYKLQRTTGGTPTFRAAWLDNLFNNLKISKWSQSNILAQVYGNVGVVTSLYAWAGTFHTNTFDSKGYSTDVWVKRNNQWQVVSRTGDAFEGSKTLDGK